MLTKYRYDYTHANLLCKRSESGHAYSLIRLTSDGMALVVLDSSLTGCSQLYRSDIVGLELSVKE